MPNIAKANQRTNIPADAIAIGSIHFVIDANELSISRVYWLFILSVILWIDAVFSHTANIVIKSDGKYSWTGSISSIDSAILEPAETLI